MNKHTFQWILIVAIGLLVTGCQSIEQLTIDYMLPAEVSFPPSLKRVGVVNNMPLVPDNKLIQTQSDSVVPRDVLLRQTAYFNGDAQIATEALAKALAEANYFDEVIIADSALRYNDAAPRTTALSPEEVNQLTQDLQVDFLIALEHIRLKEVRQINYFSDLALYYGSIDTKAYPLVRIYLPNRRGAMATITANDSIFWEEVGNTENSVQEQMLDSEEMVKQASEFGGSLPVKQLLPHWRSNYRYFYTNGSVNMRDATVMVREGNWNEAIRLWKQNYNEKKGKQQMQTAFNLAVGHEMTDDLNGAVQWADKALELAQKLDPKQTHQLYMLYRAELQERMEGMSRLTIQMDRFNEEQ